MNSRYTLYKDGVVWRITPSLSQARRWYLYSLQLCQELVLWGPDGQGGVDILERWESAREGRGRLCDITC